MIFNATSIKDYNIKIKAIKALGMIIESIELDGYFTADNDAEYKENVYAYDYCKRTIEGHEQGEYYDNDDSACYGEKITLVGKSWITLKDEAGRTRKLRFPINPDPKPSYKGAAVIRIEAIQDPDS